MTGAPAARSPLTPEERRSLAETSAVTGAAKLSCRRLESLSLAGGAFDGAQVEDSGLTDVDLRRARIANSTFHGVDFASCDVSGARIEDSQFDGCTFASIEGVGVSVARSVFAGPDPSEGMEVPRAADGVRLDGAVFEDVTFGGYEAVHCRVLNSAFLRCRFGGLSVEEGEFTACRFEGPPPAVAPEVIEPEADETEEKPEPSVEDVDSAQDAEEGEEEEEGPDDAAEANFLYVDFGAAALKDCVFRGIVFTEPHFSGAILENCRFEDCELNSLSATSTLFRGCVFRGCRLDSARVEGGSFTDCEFQSAEIEGAVFRGVSLCRTGFKVQTAIRSTTFAGSRLEGVVFDGTDLTEVEFPEFSGSEVTFSSASLNDVAIRHGACDGLVLRGGTVDRLCFSEMAIQHLKILECEWLDLQMVLSSIREAVVAAGTSADLECLESEISGLAISGGEFGVLRIEDCNVSPVCQLRNVRVLACSLSGSAFQGLSLANVEFREALVLDGARFEDLSLEDVRYGPEVGSTRFPENPAGIP